MNSHKWIFLKEFILEKQVGKEVKQTNMTVSLKRFFCVRNEIICQCLRKSIDWTTQKSNVAKFCDGIVDHAIQATIVFTWVTANQPQTMNKRYDINMWSKNDMFLLVATIMADCGGIWFCGGGGGFSFAIYVWSNLNLNFMAQPSIVHDDMSYTLIHPRAHALHEIAINWVDTFFSAKIKQHSSQKWQW